MEGREEKQKVGRECGTLIEWSDRDEVGKEKRKRETREDVNEGVEELVPPHILFSPLKARIRQERKRKTTSHLQIIILSSFETSSFEYLSSQCRLCFVLTS